MNQKELYRQKKQAELDEWQAEIKKLEAKASGVGADAQLKMNKEVEVLKGKVQEGKAKLNEVGEASEDAWKSMKDGFESAWDSIKSSADEAVAKFKD